VWDETCRDTLASSYLSSTSNQSGAAVAAAESRKRLHYAAMPSRYSFIPIALETMGSSGEDAVQLVKELGGRLQPQSGDTRATSFLRLRISIAIQRGNAASVLVSIPKSARLEELQYLTTPNI